jgi:hypothetical protein
MTKTTNLDIFAKADQYLSVHKPQTIINPILPREVTTSIWELNNLELNKLIVDCKNRIKDVKEVESTCNPVILKNRYRILSYRWGDLINICRRKLSKRYKKDKLVSGRFDYIKNKQGFKDINIDGLECCSTCQHYVNYIEYDEGEIKECKVTDNDANVFCVCRKYQRS